MYTINKKHKRDIVMKELRKKYNLTQKQLSDITGIPCRTIQNWEGGQRKCPQYIMDLVNFKLEHINKQNTSS